MAIPHEHAPVREMTDRPRDPSRYHAAYCSYSGVVCPCHETKLSQRLGRIGGAYVLSSAMRDRLERCVHQSEQPCQQRRLTDKSVDAENGSRLRVEDFVCCHARRNEAHAPLDCEIS